MNETLLGKIRAASLGPEDGRFGLRLDFDLNGYGAGDFIGNWESYPLYAKYTREEWEKRNNEAWEKIKQTMSEAKVNDICKLVGVPVEVKFENNTLSSWRVLTEVL